MTEKLSNWYECEKCGYKQETEDTIADAISHAKKGGAKGQDYFQCPNCPQSTFLQLHWYDENELAVTGTEE